MNFSLWRKLISVSICATGDYVVALKECDVNGALAGGNRNLGQLKDIFLELTKKEIKIRYKNSYIGYFWSILNPLAIATVFFFAFKLVMRVDIADYALFLITGLFPWQFFANSINASSSVFISNAPLIKKTAFPREMLVYSLVASELLHFLFSLPVIILFLFIYGRSPEFWWVAALPFLVLTQFLMIAGFSLAIASVNLFFRDMERLVAVFTHLMFFLTPIVYSMEAMPEKYRALIMLNPFTSFVLTYRDIFLNGFFNVRYFLISILWSLAVFAVGYFVYHKLKWKLAEAL